jgi:DNA-binding CsgD family transcriptional regulator/tetratricopeptide (TPR) repeat protein
VHGGDRELRAEVALLQAKAAAGSYDFDAATARLDEAAALAPESDLAVLVAAERVSMGTGDREDRDKLVADAMEAVSLARERGQHEAAALYALGMAKHDAGRRGWRREVEAAIVAARRDGNVVLECEAAETLVSLRRSDPQGKVARRVIAEMIERTRAHRLIGWERRFRTRSIWLDLHAGEFKAVHEAGETLLTEALEPWERYLATYVTAQAAIDLGLHDRSGELVAQLYLIATSGRERLRQAFWARADLEYWSGRPREALTAADEALRLFPDSTSTFLRVTRACACTDLGVDPGDPEIAPTGRFLAGARPELEALALLARGRYEEAAEGFAAAGQLWRGQHARGELRCLWEHGDALRLAGRTAEATEALLLAERRAEERGLAPLLGRIHRSLRLAGVRRSAPRARGEHGLTSRELEVLALVADGLSNPQIAGRLAVSRPTVERLVASASRKLGASTRAQAAVLAGRLS